MQNMSTTNILFIYLIFVHFIFFFQYINKRLNNKCNNQQTFLCPSFTNTTISLKLSKVALDFRWCDVYIHRTGTASVFHWPFCLLSVNMLLEQLNSSSWDQWCFFSVTTPHSFTPSKLIFLGTDHNISGANSNQCWEVAAEVLQQDVRNRIDQSEASELGRHRRFNQTVAEFVSAEPCWDHLLHFTTHSQQLFYWWLHPLCTSKILWVSMNFDLQSQWKLLWSQKAVLD